MKLIFAVFASIMFSFLIQKSELSEEKALKTEQLKQLNVESKPSLSTELILTK